MAFSSLQKLQRYRKEYRQKHKDNLHGYERKYRQKYKNILNQRAKEYYHGHLEKCREQNRIKDQKRYQSLDGKFLQYKKNAKFRNIPFELTEIQFMTFWQKPCYYCNSPIPTIGLDRVDNTKGYTMDNVVSCCKVCNLMKRNLPLDIFIEQCQRIVNKNSEEKPPQ